MGRMGEEDRKETFIDTAIFQILAKTCDLSITIPALWMRGLNFKGKSPESTQLSDSRVRIWAQRNTLTSTSGLFLFPLVVPRALNSACPQHPHSWYPHAEIICVWSSHPLELAFCFQCPFHCSLETASSVFSKRSVKGIMCLG